MGISQSGCSRSITKTDLDRAYKQGFADCAKILDEYKKELKAYEDKEEQGLLKTFPCGIGADIYSIPSETNFRLNLLHGYEENNRVYHQQVESILIHEHGWYIRGDKDNKYGTGRLFLDRFFKKTWFLTEAEAEEALAKMGVSNDTGN